MASPQHPSNKSFLRASYSILDANINRAKEGLRVCEEISRFHLKNAETAKRFNLLKHRLTNTIRGCRIDPLELLRARDTKQDVGKTFSFGPKRRSLQGVFLANAQRVKESLRVLEELMKLFDAKASQQFQKQRFAFYALEQKVVEQHSSLLHTR